MKWTPITFRLPLDFKCYFHVNCKVKRAKRAKRAKKRILLDRAQNLNSSVRDRWRIMKLFALRYAFFWIFFSSFCLRFSRFLFVSEFFVMIYFQPESEQTQTNDFRIDFYCVHQTYLSIDCYDGPVGYLTKRRITFCSLFSIRKCSCLVQRKNDKAMDQTCE